MREVVAEVVSPDAVHFAYAPPTKKRSDDGYQTTRAVKSAVAKKEKAIAKAAALRKSNAALKNKLTQPNLQPNFQSTNDLLIASYLMPER